ncbi:hypothetical protein C0058_25675 [Pseudomonas sp. NC02]|nr:hypothetical protein C0058_25675 [Pseudomonas sp. NC02]
MSVDWSAVFASKPAPTFDRVSSGCTRSNVGAGLLANRPVKPTHKPICNAKSPAIHMAGLLFFSERSLRPLGRQRAGSSCRWCRRWCGSCHPWSG